jgi:SAM-dependent methyltransferase
MKVDIRDEAAAYYDYNPTAPDDIPFYIDRIPSPESALLELGCGTGRVTLALAGHCRFIQGIDLSPAMISICEAKLAEAGIPPSKAKVTVGDITDFGLGRTFDLIIAPFRVLQNLELESDVDGLFRSIRRHLAPGGACILNTFNPNRDRERLRREWTRESEELCWEVTLAGGRITCHDRCPRMDTEKLILYPELVYRRYEEEALRDETVLKLVVRCYYPDDLENLAAAHGFDVVGRWGGYGGEVYGEGPELVLQFAEGS